jgi:hypothetical protein
VAAAACAVGRLGPDGPWVGFAPTVEDGYSLVVGDNDRTHRGAADLDDLLSLAVAYFAEALDEPPEELAATHADIGSLVRHLGSAETDPARRRSLAEAIDAVDDGLAADVVVGRLTSCLEGVEDPVARLARRAAQLHAQ